MNDLNIGALPSAAAVNAALLNRLAYNLDLSPTEYKQASSAYESISAVLATDTRPELHNSTVFPQGSFAIGTVVKPIGDAGEFDVDLVCRLASSTYLQPAQAKSLIGSCLAANGRYADKLEEKSRCWRIVYAGEFHLDVAPVVPNPAGGDWIPDRELRRWLETHPLAYAAWFNRLADTARVAVLLENRVVAKADVAPFPADPADRGWLRRLVQLLKRHRCVWAQTLPSARRGFAPISIIITTITAYAFASVGNRHFDTPLDLVRAIINDMPNHALRRPDEHGVLRWWLPSPVANENFANRWNDNPAWAECFFAWCNELSEFFRRLEHTAGLDERVTQLREAFGESAANGVAREYGDFMRKAREQGRLRMTRTGGLTAVTPGLGVTVPDHTFYGDR